MLVDGIIVLVLLLIKMFFAIMSPIFAVIPASTAYGISVGNGFGFVFGNIKLLNTFLPVTEMFVMAGISLTIKGAMLAWKISLFVYDVATYVRKTFITLRI